MQIFYGSIDSLSNCTEEILVNFIRCEQTELLFEIEIGSLERTEEILDNFIRCKHIEFLIGMRKLAI